MSVDVLKLEFQDGSSAEVEFGETDPGDGLAPRITLKPAPSTTAEKLQEKVQAILDNWFA